MHSRSPKFTYAAAFLLGALIAALLARPGRAAETFQLDRVGIVRFTAAADGSLLRQTGVLFVNGTTQLRPASSVARPANTPAAALGRNLIASEAWAAYHALGFGALQAFTLEEGSVTIAIGNEHFKFVARNPDAPLYDGRAVNLSTRATLNNGLDEIIAGFVIEGRPRAVLIRAIGPSLVPLGVNNSAHDPVLALKRNGETIAENDNWSESDDPALTARVMQRVGAFSIPAGSRDAAQVVLLAPGIYTAHVRASGPNFIPGTILLETYTVPPDALLDESTLN
jgi:hypothetical protein